MLTRNVNDQMSHEDHASDILCYHYGFLSQSLYYPSYMTQILCGEKVISDETLKAVEDTEQSESERRTVLLKAVRHAVHNNYHNLEVFASVLRIENAQVADLILNDYSECNNKLIKYLTLFMYNRNFLQLITLYPKHLVRNSIQSEQSLQFFHKSLKFL